eukprot:g3332.t1
MTYCALPQMTAGRIWSILAQLAEVGTHWTRGNRVSIRLRLPEIIHGPNISGYLPRSREMKPFGSQHDISKSHSNESRFGPDIMESRWHRVARLVTEAQHTSKSGPYISCMTQGLPGGLARI